MAYGDEKVVIDVREAERGSIVYKDKSGKETSYYPTRTAWLEIEDLQVMVVLGDTPKDAKEGVLVTRIRGIARLEDRSLSVVGDPTTKTRTLTISFETGDWRPKREPAEEIEGFGLLSTTELGGAMLGFNRADWEIGNENEWWASCYLQASFVQALETAIKDGHLAGVKVGLSLRGLYTSEGDWAPVSERGDLFIRPNRADNTLAIPDMANGFVRGIHFTRAKVDLRRPAPIEDEDFSEDEKPTPAIPIDPVAIAVDVLSARMEKLRITVKWVGGLLVAVLVLMLMK